MRKTPRGTSLESYCSCDNVGPVNPTSFEGYTQTFIWRDTSTKMMFSHSDSEASEEVYLEGLEVVRQYYKARGITSQDHPH
jgi:hypothetical protein